MASNTDSIQHPGATKIKLSSEQLGATGKMASVTSLSSFSIPYLHAPVPLCPQVGRRISLVLMDADRQTRPPLPIGRLAYGRPRPAQQAPQPPVRRSTRART
jgi:hypothetical protein